MKLSSLKIGDTVLIDWRDARSSDSWQTVEAFLEKEDFQRCQSIGRLEQIPSAAHPDYVICGDWDGSNAEVVGRLLAIPKAMVTGAKKLR